MIDVKSLTPEAVGSWCRYNDHFNERPEYGRIKSWRISGSYDSTIYVVYHADERWEDFMHFTGEGTDPQDLVLMPTFCSKDRTLLKPGKGLRSTVVSGVADMGHKSVTMHEGGSGSLVECLKCPACGYSVL